MLSKWVKRAIGLVVLALVVAAAVLALRPRPVPVDIATIDRGHLAVTIDEEGIARIRDVFRVSAPVAGRVERLPVEVGDKVHRNTTTVALIHPVDPPFLDIRSRRELEAAVEAARAAVTLARAQVNAAEAGERLAQSELDRADRLAKMETIAKSVLDKAIADHDTATAQVAEARAALNLRESELASAEARLIQPNQLEGGSSSDTCCLTIRAPVDGTVLKLLTESEQVVVPGEGLLELGDPTNLEIIVHLLSDDAVSIHPGSVATIDHWGGPPLTAAVRRVDPAAYTKVSALGIEEQRVDAILDIVDPQEEWQRLGHEFRVMVHITIWEGDDVLQVPLGALFRVGANWTVFRIVDGKAVETPVVLGHRNNRTAEVVEGLEAGALVVLHPSDRVVDGVAVEDRTASEG
ncbi:MAG: HlyD family efflux transporter periplasmic adaptor subunit [Bauldia sp.]|uniref:efflux RND transporter periplasmic adaptor subunit n=1 Tax=Bauldia sp. TaxID=2575872 RepID=UPI001E16D75A|nr:HlyD family efflux transporter periplasmic adaptor subunit [Bauldia sp.]MCB1496274.1 HlyD family efflux transporter periplasmic adaptor subunit [Bauldia sp.]